MKKFVGNVNGKAYDNEVDFMNAVKEAVKEGGENLSITRYYTYTSDNEEEEKPVDDPRFVSTHEYFLGTRKPDEVNGDHPVYIASDDLLERILNASNREGIKKSLNFQVKKLEETIHNSEESIKYLTKDLEGLQKKVKDLEETIKEKKESINDMMARENYYGSLFDYIEKAEIDEEQKKDVEEKKEYVKPEVNIKTIRDLFGLDENTSLAAMLRQFGILK